MKKCDTFKSCVVFIVVAVVTIFVVDVVVAYLLLVGIF